MRLIDNAWRDFHRLWTIRFSVGFAVFTGISTWLSAAGDVLNPYFLLALCVLVNLLLIPLARLAKQKDPEA